MNNSTQRNDSPKGNISQQKRLSFYEENYILEPENPYDETGNYNYDSERVYDLGFMDFNCN